MLQALKIKGMKCDGCATHVKESFEKINGVQHATVDLETKTATVESEELIPKPLFVEALFDTKYEVL